MKWRMMGAMASAGVLLATTAFADYIIRDVVGGCATDGYWPNSETRKTGSIQEGLAEVSGGGLSIQKSGRGRYNVYYGGCLEAYLIDLDETASADSTGSGGGSPVASSSIAVNQIIRQNIFTQAKPKPRPKKQVQSEGTTTTEGNQPAINESFGRSGRLTFGAADVFYNKWKIGDEDGETFGINPAITWGETHEITLTVPVHIINGDDTIYAVGLDGAYKHPFSGKWENFSAGVHAYGIGFFGGDDPESNFGGGPFLSFNCHLGSRLILSVGGLLELTKPDGEDLITELVPGVNLGFNLTDSIALNGYGIYYRDLDSGADNDGYTDVGADLSWALGSWSLSGGAKTSLGLDDVDSFEIYLGSEWIF